MGTSEKEILAKIKIALPNLSDFNKGYLLGLAEQNIPSARKDTKQIPGQMNITDVLGGKLRL